MSCNCDKKINVEKKMWRNLNYVRRLAKYFTKMEKKDAQIYNIGKFYNFEPINEERKDIIEYIRYNNGNR